ncbi:hypothetical protein [Paenarthrobacter nitroguajacolicus]|nr:hypothetical protein [Paenarthrobacter nitroguajacolicus]
MNIGYAGVSTTKPGGSPRVREAGIMDEQEIAIQGGALLDSP